MDGEINNPPELPTYNRIIAKENIRCPGFKDFIPELASHLTKDIVWQLSMSLGFTTAAWDTIDRAHNPIAVFIHQAMLKGIITSSGVDRLTEKLENLGLYGVAHNVKESWLKNTLPNPSAGSASNQQEPTAEPVPNSPGSQGLPLPTTSGLPSNQQEPHGLSDTSSTGRASNQQEHQRRSHAPVAEPITNHQESQGLPLAPPARSASNQQEYRLTEIFRKFGVHGVVNKVNKSLLKNTLPTPLVGSASNQQGPQGLWAISPISNQQEHQSMSPTPAAEPIPNPSGSQGLPLAPPTGLETGQQEPQGLSATPSIGRASNHQEHQKSLSTLVAEPIPNPQGSQWLPPAPTVGLSSTQQEPHGLSAIPSTERAYNQQEHQSMSPIPAAGPMQHPQGLPPVTPSGSALHHQKAQRLPPIGSDAAMDEEYTDLK